MKPKFEFNGIKPAFINGGFRAFVQTVLPTIYDDSLSYYELLNKVVKHLNNVVSDVATINTNQENFISAVTNFINETAVETYDIDITNPLDTAQLQLSAADATALFNAIENDKIVRVFVHSASGTIYTCYYYTIVPNDNEQNNLYFAGFSFSQYETNPNIVPWKIVKIKRSGAITIYDNVNAVTKKYVDDSITETANALGERIDSLVEKAPYKVYFDVYPDPDNAINYIVASNETPLTLSMLDAEGNDIECYLVNKASADGIIYKTIKADSIVFSQGNIIISFDNIDYNTNEPENTIYKKGYYVIHGNTTDNEWAYQLSGKARGRVEFNINMVDETHANLLSFSHTPAEVYKLCTDYAGYVPCDVYLNSAFGGEENYATHYKTNAVVTIANGQQTQVVGVTIDEITNGANALQISHYSIYALVSASTWTLTLNVYEYPVSTGGVEDIEGTAIGNNRYTVNKTIGEIATAMQQGARIRVIETITAESETLTASIYLTLAAISYQGAAIENLLVYSAVDARALSATESGGVTTFSTTQN